MNTNLVKNRSHAGHLNLLGGKKKKKGCRRKMTCIPRRGVLSVYVYRVTDSGVGHCVMGMMSVWGFVPFFSLSSTGSSMSISKNVWLK